MIAAKVSLCCPFIKPTIMDITIKIDLTPYSNLISLVRLNVRIPFHGKRHRNSLTLSIVTISDCQKLPRIHYNLWPEFYLGEMCLCLFVCECIYLNVIRCTSIHLVSKISQVSDLWHQFQMRHRFHLNGNWFN